MENPRDNTPSIIIAAGRKHAKAHGVAEESDYSSSVRKKLSTSSRTGQACDRCKIRKIRCDSAVGGCSPCRQTQATCKTTDRITGKATVRGLTDILEGENRYLKTKLREMQQQMRDLGIQVEDDGDSSQYASQSQLQPREEPRWDLPHQHNSSRRNTHAIIEIPQENTSLFRRHIANETGSLSQDPGFSLLRGTKLALFGMQIDLAEFADDISEVDSPATYEGFMEQIFNRTPPNDPAPLPPNLQAAKEYMQWYLRFLNPYTPILHKSDINELLAKFYEDPTPGPRPGRPAAEEVVVHMMFSLIKYQYGQRNKIQSMIDEAMAHFQYCLKFWPDLVKSQTLQDVQAMTLISLQIRSFPKPGAAWYCGTMALTTAIEIGMNRSAAAWSALDPRPMTVHEMEMRKRIFWTLYTLVIGLSGRLGRPMPLRLSDIDIEFPQPINDNLPEEGSIAEFRQCSFHVGIAIDKILALSGELYSTFYSVSGCRPEKYDANIARFEADLASFRSSIHPELQDSRRAEGEVKIFALYIELYALETEFLLRHPLIMHSNDGERFKEQLICAREHVPKTLRVLRILRDANCLDVPWFTVTTFLAMIFTTLFAENQRREEITDGELEKLKGEMDGWLNILGDIGIMLGSGDRLQNYVGQIVLSVIRKLSQRLAAKSAESVAAVANEAIQHSQQRRPSVAEVYAAAAAAGHHYGSVSGPSGIPTEVKHESPSVYPTPDTHGLDPTQTPYPNTVAPTQYPVYASATPVGPTTYPNNAYIPQPNYVTSAEQVPTQLPMSTQQPHQLPISPIYVAPNGQPAGLPYYATNDLQNTPTNEWLRWGHATMNGFHDTAPQDYMVMGNLAAGTTAVNGAQMATAAQGVQQVQGQDVQDPNNQWPINIFAVGHGQGNGG